MKNIIAMLLAVSVCFGMSPAYAAPITEAKKTEAKKPAVQQTEATSGTGKHDTKMPVEISSDNLEVLQRESKAIFRGNVIAVQGKLRLSADKMTVHYKQQSEKHAAPALSSAASVPEKKEGDMGAITHIEVEGHVLVATPEETAEGDKGDYDVEKRFLHLTGENVVLTRGQNILRGKAVDYNLDTGHSILTNADGGKKGKGDNRVRGVFVPNADKK